MNLAAYDAFFEAHRTGRKSAAKAAVRVFTASFASFEEKQAWVSGFLRTHDPETRIRHEIYEELVLPVLLKGYHASDAWSTQWLAVTARNLHEARHQWAQLDFISTYALLKRWYCLAPESAAARQALLEKLIDRFVFSEHEWPGVILCGMGGATLEQCRQHADAVVEARALDIDGEWTSFLDEFDDKLRVYQARLLLEAGQ